MAPLSSLPGNAPPESRSCQQCTRECYCPNGRRGPWGGSRRRGVPHRDANEGDGTRGGREVGCSLGALRSAEGWIVTARAVAETDVGAAVESAIRATSEYTGVEAGVHMGNAGERTSIVAVRGAAAQSGPSGGTLVQGGASSGVATATTVSCGRPRRQPAHAGQRTE